MLDTYQNNTYQWARPPIPPPMPLPEPPSFKVAFSKVFTMFWFWITSLYLPTIWFVYGAYIDRFCLIRGVAAALIITLLLSLISVYGFRVFMDESGIRGYNFWGYYSTLPWSDIISVIPANFLGLRYLKIGCYGTRNTLWVPLFLADMQSFRSLVATYAAPDHLLCLYLEESD